MRAHAFSLSSRSRHTRLVSDWSSDVCSSDLGILVSTEIAHQKTLLSHNAEAEAERDKMARLKKLRLEKEAAEKLAIASMAVVEPESAGLLRKRPEKGIRNNLKATPSQLNSRSSG